MDQIKRGNGPGFWQPVVVGEFGPLPRWSAIVWCPSCARPLSAVNHLIAPNGQITPSLGHPTEYPACDWHTSPQLVGWEALPPLVAKPQHTCERCGAKNALLSGWGTWSGGPGLICGDCVADVTKALAATRKGDSNG